MVGLLTSRSDAEQTENYTWTKQEISNETYFRPGQFVTKVDNNSTNAPVLQQKSITRDGATYTTSYSAFDTYGNPTSVSEAGPNGGSRTTTLGYYTDTSKWIIRQVQNESFSGGSVTRNFDGNGNLTSITRDGVVTTYSYDGQGNVSSATLPRSLTSSYSSYKRGIAQSETQPEGIFISRVVSDAGNVTSETNGESRTTAYTYDGLNRVKSIDYPAGSSATISYGTASKTATRGSLTETTQYDGFGRTTSITLGGIARSYTVDALGRTTFASDPASSAGTSYQYDILNRLTRVSHSADGTYQAIAYGAASKTVTNERTKSTTSTYRAYGDPDRQFLMGIASPVSAANLSMARNSRDLVTSITQAGITRTYGYNGSYYLTSVTNPETGNTTYGRDSAGNMTSRTVGSSGLTTFGYDGQNRLASVTYPGSTPAVTQSYTRTSKLQSVTTSAVSRNYSYDANDNLTNESMTINGITLAATYGYNTLDQLSSITYPRSGSVVSYSPDVLGRPTQVSGYVNSVSYWPSGQISQINYGNGTVTAYGQGTRLWPSSFSTQKGGTFYSNSLYGYDGVGNLTSISDFTDSSYTRTLNYDDIDRLASASGPWGGGTIAYSGGGNITSQSFGTFSLIYSYDGSNRLSSVSGYRAASYGYDAYGNITSGAGNSYAYEGAPNLTCINCSDPALKIAYVYDGLNRRVSVTKGGVTSYEFYDSRGNQLVEYTPSQSNKLVEYIYLGGKRVAQRVSP
ncbi:MAG: RHS repeat protein [Ramlibacter sp.]|nr:RHS repeat protein [Ramlibacter sp.]